MQCTKTTNINITHANYKAHTIKQLGKKQALEGSNLELQVPTN
jgi:hypothetical protein